MANWTILKEAIASVIKTNGNQEITGAVLQNTLNSIVNSIGENATFAGIATPTTNPGTPDGPVFYFANQAGVYANFGGIVVDTNQFVTLRNINDVWQSYEIVNTVVTTNKLANEAVTTAKIADAAVTTAKIADAAVTTAKLSNDIKVLIANISKNATFAGIATPTTNPGTPDGPVFYLTATAGTYPNFNGIEVRDGEAVILLWNNNAWSKKVTGFVTQEKLSELGEQLNNYSNSAVLVGVVNTAGEFNSNLNFYRTTDFIKIVRGQYYYIKTKVVNPWAVATFYANDLSFAGKYILGGESTQEISEYEGYFEIDGFIRVSTMYDTINDFVFILGSKEYVEIKEINEKQYARAVRGKNLFNEKNITNGYLNVGGSLRPVEGYFTTDYIQVTGNLVCNKNNSPGAFNCVYGKDYIFIRNFSTPNYTYQEGDSYVRYSNNNNSLEGYQIEEGDVSTEYFPYTDKQDVIDIINKNVLPNYFPYVFISDRSNNYAGITFNISNPSGNTKRKYGMDITKGASKGFVEIQLFNYNKVVGKYKTSITFICNSESIGKFSGFGQTKEQLGKGLFKFSKITEISDTPNTISHVIMCEAPTDDSLIYIRLLSVEIEALDESAKYYVKGYCDKYPHDFNVIEKDIYHGFDSTTEGWGITKFSSLIDAVNSTSNREDLTRQYIYRIMPGEYREWETQWKGSDSETGQSMYGISPKGNSVIESFDTDAPELVKLAWDGHVGFSDGYIMTAIQCGRRCILNISTELYCKTIIDGLYFDTKNVRYCIHPESAGHGFGNTWLIKNCILHDGGRPQGEGFSHPIGTGISPGEYGHVYRCNILSSSGQGIGGHDNPNNKDIAYPLLYGGNLVIEECNLNDNDIRFTSIYDDANTPFQLSIKGCGNVKDIITKKANEKPNQWRVSVICSDFNSIQEDDLPAK